MKQNYSENIEKQTKYDSMVINDKRVLNMLTRRNNTNIIRKDNGKRKKKTLQISKHEQNVIS